MPDDTRLRIVLEAPPAGVDYGLQKGRGSIYETVQTHRSVGADLTFDFGAEAQPSDAAVDFRGPFVQGPRGGRFVYIDIGACAGQMNTPWSRRLKIPLSGITPQMIRRVASENSVLEARVPGTGRDGTPACASVKDFAGWKVIREGRSA